MTQQEIPGSPEITEHPAGLKRAFLEECKTLLLERRQALLNALGSLAGEGSKSKDVMGVLNVSPHPTDLAASTAERQVALELVESEQRELRQISGALARLADGTFGVCQSCGGSISVERLLAIPYAALCLECKRREERQG